MLCIALLLSAGCSGRSPSENRISIYYTIDGTWTLPQEGCVEVVATMTMPDGSESHGNTCTPFKSETQYYEPGTPLGISAEPVRDGSIVTVKIFRNGTLWKTQTTTSAASGHSATAQVLATL